MIKLTIKCDVDADPGIEAALTAWAWAAYAEAVDYCEKVIASHNATAPLADESKGTQS